jgi:hypothetical protein
VADAKLRELEHRWEESQSDEDRLRFLEERLRQGERLEDLESEEGALLLRARLTAGDLDEQAVGLAAHCELAAAREALERPPRPSDDLSLASWVEGLEPFGREPLLRVLDVLTRLALAAFDMRNSASDDDDDDDDHHGDDDDDDDGILEEDDGEDARQFFEEVQSLLEQWVDRPQPKLIERARQALEDAVDCGVGHSLTYDVLGTLVHALGDDGSLSADDLAQAADRLADTSSQEAMHSALRRQVLLWALRPRTKAERAARDGARGYSPKQRFREGEVIDHPKFGEGSVVRVAARQIEVKFSDGVRKLAHGL